MTFEEARSEAVQGARITSNSIQTGAYVDYQFHGLRIVYASGSHSGFRPLPDDYAADWGIVELVKLVCDCGVIEGYRHAPECERKRDAWGRPTDPKYVQAVDALIGARDKWGRPA